MRRVDKVHGATGISKCVIYLTHLQWVFSGLDLPSLSIDAKLHYFGEFDVSV